jgi:hypothetical protein
VRWDRQVLTWYERAQKDKTVLLVRYEDMVADRGNMLQAVLNFSGVSHDPAQLATVVAEGSFEAMRKSEDTYGAESYLKVGRERAKFVRRGRTDGWKTEMEPSVIRQVESEFGSVMRIVGYELSA